MVVTDHSYFSNNNNNPCIINKYKEYVWYSTTTYIYLKVSVIFIEIKFHLIFYLTRKVDNLIFVYGGNVIVYVCCWCLFIVVLPYHRPV